MACQLDEDSELPHAQVIMVINCSEICQFHRPFVSNCTGRIIIVGIAIQNYPPPGKVSLWAMSVRGKYLGSSISGDTMFRLLGLVREITVKSPKGKLRLPPHWTFLCQSTARTGFMSAGIVWIRSIAAAEHIYFARLRHLGGSATKCIDIAGGERADFFLGGWGGGGGALRNARTADLTLAEALFGSHGSPNWAEYWLIIGRQTIIDIQLVWQRRLDMGNNEIKLGQQRMIQLWKTKL